MEMLHEYSHTSLSLVLFCGALGLILMPLFVSGQSDSTNAVQQLQQLQRKFSNETPQQTSVSELVKVTTALKRDGIHPGDTIRVAVLLEIREGWHVNAHEPTLDYLIGTSLEFDGHPEIAVIEKQYPAPSRLAFGFAGEELAVYDGTAVIYVKLRVGKNVIPGNYELAGTLRLQACNDKLCLSPSTIPVSLTIPVVETDQSMDNINESFYSD